jgi:hypothetical protein
LQAEDGDYRGPETEPIEAEWRRDLEARRTAYRAKQKSIGLEMGGTGLEHTAFSPPRTTISPFECAQSGSLDSQKSPADPDLALLVARWLNLPEHIRAAVMALVRSHKVQDTRAE